MTKLASSLFLNFLIITTIYLFTLASSSHLTSGQLTITRNKLAKYVELGQALNYGDGCSWEAEEYRQNFTRVMLNSGTSNIQILMEQADTAVERNYTMCNPAKLYVCDQESLKCVCGSTSLETLMGVNRSLFTLEGTDQCRWNTGTYCVGEDQMETVRQMGFMTDSKCKTGTTCRISDEEGELCSTASTMEHLIHKHGFLALFDMKLVQEEVLSGRVCSCKADEVIEEGEDDEGDVFNNSEANGLEETNSEATRRKRSVTVDNLGVEYIPKYFPGMGSLAMIPIF